MQEVSKFISVGGKINLLQTVEANVYQYVSRVEALNEDGTIDVLIPISKNRIVYIKNDTVLKVVVAREGAIYEFKAKIVNKLFGAIPLLRLMMVSEVEKIQRRNYFRLKVMLNIKIRRLINLKENTFDDSFSASMVDISGGGLALIAAKELEINDVIEMNMNLNSNSIRVLGTIVRKELKEESSLNKFAYGVSYEKITELQRNIIMKYIFEEQRKLAKKGLI